MVKLTRGRFLTFNGILLVCYYQADNPPYDQEKFKNLWHIPGREVMSTEAVISLAKKRQVPLSRTESSGGVVTLTRLN